MKCTTCGGSGEVERGDKIEACSTCHGLGERQSMNFWDAEDEADRRREEKAWTNDDEGNPRELAEERRHMEEGTA